MKRKGFTLIEVVCCLSIFLIIASGVVLNTSKLKRVNVVQRLKQTGKMLLMDLRLTKIEAMINAGASIIFKDNGYLITRNNIIIKQVKFENGITYDLKYCTIPENKKITFTGYGTLLPRPCSVALKDEYGNTMVISIKVGTYTVDFKKIAKEK